jgi:hypothetical protein
MPKFTHSLQVGLLVWLPPLVLLVVGYTLWQAYQPQCEPCLVDEACPPCRSPAQYCIASLIGGLLLLWLVWLRGRVRRKQVN